jgi:predicted adenine nucleotide alpha hydrolase (AANH) superfamily ATPase
MSDDIRLILMSCCAPCSCGAIQQVLDDKICRPGDFLVMFFNPNIYPMDEYQKRLNEQIKYCEKLGVKYVVGDYDHNAWLESVAGLENEPERGLRCSKCFAYRFCFAREYAKRHGFNTIASVFGVSRFKSQAQVDAAAQSSCGDIKYLSIKWDEDLRQKINRKSDFYRQKYCGCEFSMRK